VVKRELVVVKVSHEREVGRVELGAVVIEYHLQMVFSRDQFLVAMLFRDQRRHCADLVQAVLGFEQHKRRHVYVLSVVRIYLELFQVKATQLQCVSMDFYFGNPFSILNALLRIWAYVYFLLCFSHNLIVLVRCLITSTG